MMFISSNFFVIMLEKITVQMDGLVVSTSDGAE